MKYKCLETFSLPEYPEYDDGVETEREITVPAGSIWEGEKPVREIEQELLLIESLDLCPECREKSHTMIIARIAQPYTTIARYSFLSNKELEEAE
ncbi:hypothetical protein IGK16_002373 [Enterococcus pernyi]